MDLPYTHQQILHSVRRSVIFEVASEWRASGRASRRARVSLSWSLGAISFVATAFLASAGASAITAQCFTVDGGFTVGY